MDRYGGPARQNLFVVELSPTNSEFIPVNDLRFFCKTVSVPGINLNVAEYKPYGFGLDQAMPMGLNKDPLTCIFMLDSNHRVLSFFHEWMQSIVNYDTSRGINAPSGSDPDHLPYEIGYKKDFSVRMTIRIFSSSDRDVFYECVLDGVYPIQVSPLEMSWESNNTISTLPVTFSYSDIKMQGTRAGEVLNNFSRSIGYIDRFNSIGRNGQAFQFGGRPDSIQRIVDEFTKIKRTFSAIGSLF